MFSTLPASSFASPTASFLDRSADSVQCVPQDAALYNFNYSPSGSPFDYHHGNEFYHAVSPSHAPYLQGHGVMAPPMYAAAPTIAPPHHKRLRSERDGTSTPPRRRNDFRRSHADDDDEDQRGCDSSASDEIVAARHHRRKRHHASSDCGEGATVPVYISKEEYRKMKNRQSAARSREKSLAKVRVLEHRVAELEQENDYLLELLASVSSVKPAPPTRPIAIDINDSLEEPACADDAETAADELMDRVASHCAEALYDGVEWCL